MNHNQMKDMAAFAASKTKGKKPKGKNPFKKNEADKTMPPTKGANPFK